MAQLTTRQRMIAQQLDGVSSDELNAHTRRTLGIDANLLDALLVASTQAPFGRIPAATIDRIVKITGDRKYVEQVAEFIEAVPPHQRDQFLATFAVGEHDAKMVGKLAQDYANLSASDYIEAKRAAADKASRWNQPKQEKPRQDVVDYRNANESRRAAVERAAGISRDPGNIARAAVNPAFGDALAGILDHSNHVLENADIVSRRDTVEAAFDGANAMDLSVDLVGLEDPRPNRE